MIVVRTNIPFILSEYPQLSGVSNILAEVGILSSYQPVTNVWPNAGVIDFSTNASYGYTMNGDLSITGFVYTGSFSTNDPTVHLWLTNHDGVTHTFTVPASCRTTTGARVNYVTNALVSDYEFHIGYGMTNLIIRNLW